MNLKKYLKYANMNFIKNYFTFKGSNSSTEKAPLAICPNCWGEQKWDGEFYKLNKGNKLVGNEQIYNNFINKFVESNISGIAIGKDPYECQTCKITFK